MLFGAASRSSGGSEPRFATQQDELSSRIVLGQMLFDRLPILRRQATDDFGYAAALTGPGQIKCPLNR
jgi:hypothetical protein